MAEDPADTATRRPARVRTHLANERTYLAWIRTGMASIALGLAAAELLSSNEVLDVPLNRGTAIVFIMFGLLVTSIGHARHRTVRNQIEADEWREPRGSIELVTIGVYALGIVATVVALKSLGE